MSEVELYQSVLLKLGRLTPRELAEVDSFLAKLIIHTLPDDRAATKKTRLLGSMKGLVKHMAPDFNAPLEDFKEYM